MKCSLVVFVTRSEPILNQNGTGISRCEDSLTLRLTSELVDLRVANANPYSKRKRFERDDYDGKTKNLNRLNRFRFLVSQLQTKSNSFLLKNAP